MTGRLKGLFFYASILTAGFWGLFCLPGTAVSAEELRAVQHQLMLLSEEEYLTAINVVELENLGGAANQQIFIPLPQAHGEVTTLDGWQSPQISPQGIRDGVSIQPGEKVTLSYSYRLPMPQNRLVIPFEVGYLTETIHVMIPPQSLSVEALHFLTQSEAFSYDGQYLRRFTRLNLHPGESWSLRLEKVMGEPTVSQIEKGKHPSGLPVVYNDYGQGVEKAVFNLVFIGVVLAFGFVGVRTSLWRSQWTVRRDAEESYAKERERLLEALVRLEKEFVHGKVAEEEYRQERERMVQQLLPYYHLLREQAGT